MKHACMCARVFFNTWINRLLWGVSTHCDRRVEAGGHVTVAGGGRADIFSWPVSTAGPCRSVMRDTAALQVNIQPVSCRHHVNMD